MNYKTRAMRAGLALSMLTGLAGCASTATPSAPPYGPHVRGTLYGYIVVYKQHERSNRDVMPIQLVFAER